jgi:uncharacterized RDD family membrane protein YckC
MSAAGQNTPPGIFRRLASMLYEALLLLGVIALTVLLPHTLLGAFTRHIASPIVYQAHFFIALLIYFTRFWSNGRQTLATKTWRIRIVTRVGQAVRPAQALLRYLLCWPSFAMAGAGILWALVDRDKQFLHDRIAGTRLVMI